MLPPLITLVNSLIHQFDLPLFSSSLQDLQSHCREPQKPLPRTPPHLPVSDKHNSDFCSDWILGMCSPCFCVPEHNHPPPQRCQVGTNRFLTYLSQVPRTAHPAHGTGHLTSQIQKQREWSTCIKVLGSSRDVHPIEGSGSGPQEPTTCFLHSKLRIGSLVQWGFNNYYFFSLNIMFVRTIHGFI